MKEFGVQSVLDLDAHNHYFWSSATLQDLSVAHRLTANKPSQAPSSLFSFSEKESKLKMFVNTVTPQEFKMVSEIENENVKVGLGLHPWYVEESDIDLFEKLLPTTRFIGEVGLDFSKRFTQSQKETQQAAFLRICNAISVTFAQKENDVPLKPKTYNLKPIIGDDPLKPKTYNLKPILSVHTCKTQGTTHEILKRSGVLENAIVIYHHFGDGPETLKLAISDGCLFSVSERMLSSKKGAELAKLIPEEQLLFETDMPKAKGDFWTAKDTQESIISAWQKWMKMENATSK